MIEKKKRPKTTIGKCYRIETGCGHFYITVNRNKETGELVELLASLGKAGGCAIALNEALTRTISLGLKYSIPIEEYIKQLEGIRCPTPVWEDGIHILSCPDAIAKVLELEIKEKRNGRADS